jgi:hypothetical protein
MPPKPKPISLRIELQDIKPLIWRRIIVPNHWSLAALHDYLQWVVGWQDSHAHEFRVGEHTIAPQWWIHETSSIDDAAKFKDERKASIAAVVAELGIGGVFEYLYDMGDDWNHRIVVEAPPAAWTDHDLPMPVCTAGENACPPEDVGGPPGYAGFLEGIRDPRNDEYVNMLNWIGGVFDPAGFDLNRLNRDWRGAKRGKR